MYISKTAVTTVTPFFVFYFNKSLMIGIDLVRYDDLSCSAFS